MFIPPYLKSIHLNLLSFKRLDGLQTSRRYELLNVYVM